MVCSHFIPGQCVKLGVGKSLGMGPQSLALSCGRLFVHAATNDGANLRVTVPVDCCITDLGR